ncbi:hypothetical protein F511_40030 [Dorcoceras hygrometricum]|uniref:Mucin-2-like n=1 Tax=Dorcoceras hygrometricum TaxID=472368 RepID=A0A2Z7CZB9_9LAMI|nr:hypothetical protein F511_40030 [Dorcoceras hygrometricum]
MASSLFVNTVHVCFESVLAMDNARMVAMFESLVATGLKGFLGCPAVIHDAALLEFFDNGEVRDGLVVSTVNGVSVEISEQLLAEKFELPMEGLTDLLEIPKDLVFDAKSIVSFSGEPLGDIVDFLRGGDAKKGEGSSSRRVPKRSAKHWITGEKDF